MSWILICSIKYFITAYRCHECIKAGLRREIRGPGHIVEVGPFLFSDKWRDNYCARAMHNQHVKHANAKRSGGMPPQENFEK